MINKEQKIDQQGQNLAIRTCFEAIVKTNFRRESSNSYLVILAIGKVDEISINQNHTLIPPPSLLCCG